MSAKTGEMYDGSELGPRAAGAGPGLHGLYDAFADSVVVVDDDGRVQDMNPSAETLFATTSADAAGRALTDILPELAPLMPLADLLVTSRAQGGVAAEVADDGRSAIPVHFTVSESRLAGQRCYLLVVRDFRRVAVAQQRLLRTERLAAIGATMTALAHESRNALQRMQSCLTLIRLRGNPSVLELVDDMQDAQDQLQRLYEEVRSFAAPLKLEPQPTDMRKLIGRTWRQLGLRWRSRNLAWSLEAGDRPEDTSAYCDPRWMGQALRNVLENAIDASPERGPVRCTLASRDDLDPACLEIAIEDRGPGIPSESRERVFDLLYTTKPEGTGMGLAITQRIVCEHAGEIGVEDRPQGGTRVVIKLPREATAA